jgi:UDP-glucose 4-epimerase
MNSPVIEGQEILVTGGAGFIGSHIAERLVGDNSVTVLDDLSSGHRGRLTGEERLVKGDVRDPDALSEAAGDGLDVVFHEAANVSVPRSVEEPRWSHEVNLDGTLEVLELARREDARVVFASSAAVYGDPDSLPVDETHRTEPLSPYGIEKLAADLYVRRYHDLYGLDTVALRYFNVYGPRQSATGYNGVITAFLDLAAGHEPLTIDGDGSQTRDFVHVDDVVQANLLAAATNGVGESYNVGTGESVTVSELAEVVNDLAGSDAGVTHGPPRAGDIDASRADVSKAREALGYDPAVGLREGLAPLVERPEP